MTARWRTWLLVVISMASCTDFCSASRVRWSTGSAYTHQQPVSLGGRLQTGTAAHGLDVDRGDVQVVGREVKAILVLDFAVGVHSKHSAADLSLRHVSHPSRLHSLCQTYDLGRVLVEVVKGYLRHSTTHTAGNSFAHVTDKVRNPGKAR